MMRQTLIAMFLALSFGLATPAHAARLPSAEKVQQVTVKYFNKYGKKYPSTVFANDNLDIVQINKIYEVSYKIVYADVVLTFDDGKVGRALMKMNKRFPKGWHVISWEMVGLR